MLDNVLKHFVKVKSFYWDKDITQLTVDPGMEFGTVASSDLVPFVSNEYFWTEPAENRVSLRSGEILERIDKNFHELASKFFGSNINWK